MTLATDLQSPTWVARLTPPIPAAIATIAIQGPQASQLAKRLIRLRKPRDGQEIDELEIGRIHYGLWNSHDDQAAEQVVVCRTDQMRVEIHCHGGQAVCQWIMRDLVNAGALECSANDFPIALTNDADKSPLDSEYDFENEANEDLLKATTSRVAGILLDQANGALRAAIEDCTKCISKRSFSQAREKLQKLLHWRELGLHLILPWRIVLAGPPNAGKSSLMNAIVGQQRAIVHHHPGTTRDWIESLTAIDGWPVSITDTAGIRDSQDAIELAGIQKAADQLQIADLVVLVVDASVGWTEVHDRLLEAIKTKRSIIAWNKLDLIDAGTMKPIPDSLPVSAKSNEGLPQLLAKIAQQLVTECPSPMSAVPFRPGHFSLIETMLAKIEAT